MILLLLGNTTKPRPFSGLRDCDSIVPSMPRTRRCLGLTVYRSCLRRITNKWYKTTVRYLTELAKNSIYVDNNMSSSTSCLNFRSFIDSLREDDDLAEIDESVDPYLEVGAITRKALEARKRAPLFNNVKGASSGLFRILGAPGGLRKPGANEFGRVALHLGLSIDSTARDIINKSIAVRESTGIKPRVVLTGPCKENMIFGDDIDLEKLPVPFLHRGDGGKYLQTYGLNCIQTPDGTWTNWSINRAMVCGKNAMTGLLVTSQHVNQIYQMYKRKGQDAPWALVLGAPPAAVYVGSMPLPDHANEVDYAGAVAGSPVEVVKCETNDLLVPANAEIVLEGYISTSESAEEGPFTEMYGYVFADEVRKAEVFHVQAITYRNDAILPICPAGRFPDETVCT